MITVFIYGLDQFVVGHLSKDMTSSLAKLYEVEEDEISFVANSNMVFHNGVEQTSWNTLVHVHAPMKVSVLQDLVAKYIISSIKGVSINVAVEFYYYSQDNRFQEINFEYPRFIKEDNIVQAGEEYDSFDDDCDDDCDCDHHMQEGEGSDEIYTGDIFADFNKNKK